MNKKNYRVSRATLYNTIELLLESGLVRKHQFGDSFSQYERCYFNNQHDHLIITDTGEVKEFCEVNFNINFPLTAITEVKGENAHEIFKWAKENHGKSAVPKWNFYKILINKEGKIEDTYSSFTKPLSNKIIKKIESIL